MFLFNFPHGCAGFVLISKWIIEKDGLTALFKCPWPPLWFTLLPPSPLPPPSHLLSLLCHHHLPSSSLTLFSPLLTFQSVPFCFLLYSHVLLMLILFCDGLFRGEWVARLAGQQASTYHPSARHAVVLEFCWELSPCLCLFLGFLTLLTHIHTLSLFLYILSLHLGLTLPPFPSSWLISALHLNSNTQLVNILNPTSGSSLQLKKNVNMLIC